jgi:hypothetical protein
MDPFVAQCLLWSFVIFPFVLFSKLRKNPKFQ